MQDFDRKWEGMATRLCLQMILYIRYMDDGRKLMHPIKRGWRLVEGKLQYCKLWEEENMGKKPLEITLGIIKEAINGITGYLEFTVESCIDYEDGWLPMLDTKLRVTEDNILHVL